MCFDVEAPKVPDSPPIPSADNDEARRRRAAQQAQNQAQRGRAATIITSPLGDPGFGQNVRRTSLGAI